MHIVRIRAWGHSYGITFPRRFMRALGLVAGDHLKMVLDEGYVYIMPLKPPLPRVLAKDEKAWWKP